MHSSQQSAAGEVAPPLRGQAALRPDLHLGGAADMPLFDKLRLASRR